MPETVLDEGTAVPVACLMGRRTRGTAESRRPAIRAVGCVVAVSRASAG